MTKYIIAKYAINIMKDTFSPPGFETKTNKLCLYFDNQSSKKVKIHDWDFKHGKAFSLMGKRGSQSELFTGTKNRATAFLAEHEFGLKVAGVAGTFGVSVADDSGSIMESDDFYVYFRNKGREDNIRIYADETREMALNKENANGDRKDIEVRGVVCYMIPIEKSDYCTAGFALVFKDEGDAAPPTVVEVNCVKPEDLNENSTIGDVVIDVFKETAVHELATDAVKVIGGLKDGLKNLINNKETPEEVPTSSK